METVYTSYSGIELSGLHLARGRAGDSHYPLPTTSCPPPTIYYLLPTTVYYYLLPTTYYLLLLRRAVSQCHLKG